MIPLFLGLTAVNLVGLLVAAAFGYARAADPAVAPRHMLTGMLAALVCVAVHCVVLTYFMATAKWARHAVGVKRLDPGRLAPTRSFKAQAFPAALCAMASVFLAAVAGAGADNYGPPWPGWHHGLAVTAIGVNVLVACVEYRAIRRNGLLIDAILADIARGRGGAAGTPPGVAPAGVTRAGLDGAR